MIKIQNLTKTLDGSFPINDLSFEFEKGILGIMTSSKKEKTTLLSILSANDTSFSGKVFYKSLDLQNDTATAKCKIGYLIDGAPIYEDMTAREFLIFIGQAKRIPRDKLCRYIDEVLGLVELSEKKGILVAKLSLKERKLLSIAQALIGNPTVIILDDPFSSLDADSMQIAKAIIKMLADIKPVFLTGVSSKHMIELCNSILIISDGKPSFYDDLTEFKKEFACDDSADASEVEAVENADTNEPTNESEEEEI